MASGPSIAGSRSPNSSASRPQAVGGLALFRYQQKELEIGTALAQDPGAENRTRNEAHGAGRAAVDGVAAFTVDGGIERHEENSTYALARSNVNLQNTGKTDVKVSLGSRRLV